MCSYLGLLQVMPVVKESVFDSVLKAREQRQNTTDYVCKYIPDSLIKNGAIKVTY